MIDLTQLVNDKEVFPAEYYEFLRQTLPNTGFFVLMETTVRLLNQDLINLDTNCTDEKFRHKYDKLVLERDLYLQLKQLAEMLGKSTNEET